MSERLLERTVDYQTALDEGVSFCDLDPNTRVEFGALDIAICAMNMDPRFKSEFENQGTDLEQILKGISNLDTFFSAVTINCGQDMVNEGHIKSWGRNIMQMAEYGLGTNGNGPVNEKLRDFVLSEKSHFGIEISE